MQIPCQQSESAICMIYRQEFARAIAGKSTKCRGVSGALGQTVSKSWSQGTTVGSGICLLVLNLPYYSAPPSNSRKVVIVVTGSQQTSFLGMPAIVTSPVMRNLLE